ncbi:hypothetical protein [Marinobacter daepoensis]|uniref:hypothetical protein n=1 Tax=Marinobacter daepoensis TaxID=262077 RepID=UPI0004245F08|nr:hypothetical protein [Marinobacter daepoensis]
MFKKTLISLAVASSLGLTGCFDNGSDSRNENPKPEYADTDSLSGKTYPFFAPGASRLPVPNDLLYSGTVDGTFNLDVDDKSTPPEVALNQLSGASTVAPIVILTSGQLDESAGNVQIGKNVHLIELAYASGDPVQGLGAGESPTLEITLSGPANMPKVRAEVETLGGTSAIRILPLEPLKPGKRYVVVVTNGVKDINGEPIIQDPSYSNLTAEGTKDNPGAELPSQDLLPVRTLINKLWEPIAINYAKAIGQPLTEEQIALSYSFTTSKDEKVLQYIAEPASWFEDQLTGFLSVSAAKSAIEAGASDYASIKSTVNGTIAGFPSDSIKTALAPAFDAPPPLGCQGTTGQVAVSCVSVALATSLSPLLPTPTTSNRGADDFTLGAPTGVGLVSAVANKVYKEVNTLLGGNAPTVLAVQGTVSLPYYLGATAETVGAKAWKADNNLATSLNSKFESINLKIPQGVKGEGGQFLSEVVNTIFPFPAKETDVDVPVLIIYPQIPNTRGVVQFQHGITTDRSAALTFGTALAALGYTVVAIDQPLHGVDSFTQEDQELLARTLLLAANPSFTDTEIAGLTALILAEDQATLAAQVGDPNTATSLINTVKYAGSTIPGIAASDDKERHFGLSESGELFINLLNFTNTRDNVRQSAVDQMNLRMSLNDLDLSQLGGASLNGSNFYLAGHSLGTITGTPFAASVNANQVPAPGVTDNDISGISLLTPGAGIVRMLENSPAFAPSIIAGLANASTPVPQNTPNYSTFLNVFQAAMDSADPINFIDNLRAGNAGVYNAIVQGDLVIPNAADEKRWGIEPLEGTLPGELAGQQVMVDVDSFPAPLAGSYPLVGLGEGLDAAGIESSPFFFSIEGYQDEEGNLGHGTPVSAQPAQAFAEMVLGTDSVFSPVP